MNLAIVGYGAMGKEIEALINEQNAKQQNINIKNIFDIHSPINENENYDFDVAIEFSNPAVVLNNVKLLAQKGKNIVIGTTGWHDKIDIVQKYAEDYNVGIIWASNFSIGMQIFYRIVNEASNLINNCELYDAFISEIHHKNKKDAPSGTAISLANIILQNLQSKNKILTENINRPIQSNELQITSTRGGNIFGEHSIYFDSEADTIKLIHNAKNRKGFAFGAIQAAKYIFNKKGFYNFENILF